MTKDTKRVLLTGNDAVVEVFYSAIRGALAC